MKKYILGVMSLILLTSCSGFNTTKLQPVTLYDNSSIYVVLDKKYTQEQEDSLNTNKQVIKDNDTVKDTKLKCPPYTLPKLPKTPAIPLKEISAISPDDYSKLSSIEKDHIVLLHKYISDIKRTIKISHDNYIRDCYSIINK